jgi:hypothetical protein
MNAGVDSNKATVQSNSDSGLTIVTTEMLTRRLSEAVSQVSAAVFEMVQATSVAVNMKSYSDRAYTLDSIGGYTSMMAVRVPFWANAWGTDVNPLVLRDEKENAVVFVCKSPYHNGHSSTTLAHFLHGGGWLLETKLTPPSISHDSETSAPMKCFYKQMPSGITVSIPPTNQVIVFVDTHANQDGSFDSLESHRHSTTQCEFESSRPTYSVDRQCSALTDCFLGASHETTPPTATSNRVCTLNTACVAGEYQSTPATLSSDRECSTLTTCDYPASEYELKGPTLTTDRVCESLTSCAAGQYISTHATSTSDRTCNVWTVCGPTHYETVTPSLKDDRVCEHLTTCDATVSYQSVAPTSTSDRNCSDTTICHRPDVVKVMGTVLTDTICAINCSASEFESPAPAVTFLQRKIAGPNHCKAAKTCNSTNQFEEVTATSSSDRTCRALTQCSSSEFEEVAPTSSTDRVCAVSEKPILNVHGTDLVTIAATHTGFYADEGAVCRDVNCKGKNQVCDISQDVDITGSEFPELHLPGTYVMKYNCISSATGHNADQATRTVIIADDVPPVCTMNHGAPKVEASFPYTDPGFTCTDAIDGTLVLGSTLNTEITNNVNPEKTGTYLITYRAMDSSGNWNDCQSGRTDFSAYDVTYSADFVDYFNKAVGKETTTPDGHYAWCNLYGCPQFNSKAADWCAAGGNSVCADQCAALVAGATEGTGKNGVCTRYGPPVSAHTGCVGGSSLVRTVQVVDTLRPVIALHRGGVGLTSDTFLHSGAAADVGAGGQANPAATYTGIGTRRLMEQRLESVGMSNNAAAAACLGVATLALVAAFLQRRRQEADDMSVYTTDV